MDLDAWVSHAPFLKKYGRLMQFCYCVVFNKSCRNILLNRLHRNPVMYALTRIFFSPLDSLYINMPPESIGGGLSFQHGFATIVAAKRIGENCRIYQQVTVGYHGEYAPVIKDNVSIKAGAIVIGNIELGDGAVVTHDVKENTTVVGVPAREIVYSAK